MFCVDAVYSLLRSTARSRAGLYNRDFCTERDSIPIKQKSVIKDAEPFIHKAIVYFSGYGRGDDHHGTV